MEPNCCENCRFAQFIDSGYKTCRRYPPRPAVIIRRVILPDIHSAEAFPEVPWDEWCGEYSPRRDPPVTYPDRS